MLWLYAGVNVFKEGKGTITVWENTVRPLRNPQLLLTDRSFGQIACDYRGENEERRSTSSKEFRSRRAHSWSS